MRLCSDGLSEPLEDFRWVRSMAPEYGFDDPAMIEVDLPMISKSIPPIASVSQEPESHNQLFDGSRFIPEALVDLADISRRQEVSATLIDQDIVG
jgi:hypothetical protein